MSDMEIELPPEPGTVPDLRHGLPGPEEPMPEDDALDESDLSGEEDDDESA